MKKLITNLLLIALVISGLAFADYTVTWTAPTENTDGSPLIDLDGYNLWCLPAYQADGVTPRAYGTPSVHPATVTSYFKFWPSPAGEWKCKMQSFNTAGTVSADSPEVFFTLVDIDGDGNPEVSTGTLPPVTVPPPNAPPVVVECPAVSEPAVCPPVTGQRTMTVTRVGYYTITGPDGVWLVKPDGSNRQVTTRDEAYEWISKDTRNGDFIINPPPYRVNWQ